jgi:protein-L-isoaspartate O-methyltransferase
MRASRLQAVQVLLENVQAGHAVLDATCSTGLSTLQICNRVLPAAAGKVVALDRAPSKVERAAKLLGSALPPDLHSRVTVMPLDALTPDGCPGAPFDGILINVLLPGLVSLPVTRLTKQLKRDGGYMVAPVAIADRDGCFLTLFTRQASGSFLATPKLYLPPSSNVSVAESGIAVEGESPGERQARMDRESRKTHVQLELEKWKLSFSTTHRRRATLQDLKADKHASELFHEFAKLNRR